MVDVYACEERLRSALVVPRSQLARSLPQCNVREDQSQLLQGLCLTCQFIATNSHAKCTQTTPHCGLCAFGKILVKEMCGWDRPRVPVWPTHTQTQGIPPLCSSETLCPMEKNILPCYSVVRVDPTPLEFISPPCRAYQKFAVHHEGGPIYCGATCDDERIYSDDDDAWPNDCRGSPDSHWRIAFPKLHHQPEPPRPARM
jgi:hypothetical protein